LHLLVLLKALFAFIRKLYQFKGFVVKEYLLQELLLKNNHMRSNNTIAKLGHIPYSRLNLQLQLCLQLFQIEFLTELSTLQPPPLRPLKIKYTQNHSLNTWPLTPTHLNAPQKTPQIQLHSYLKLRWKS
jgi:hypothetical protein